MPRHTKVACEKTTAIPGGGISEKDSEVNKKSKVVQKQLAPKHTARPARSQVNINSQYPVIGSFKVATYLILIFYLTGFYCQIKISNLIGVFKVAIYSYLIDYLL
jgi:hypothetical protein